MKIKLLRSVLVGDADVTPTTGGTELDMDEAKAREFVALGLAEEVGANKAAAHQNKMAGEPENKAIEAAQEAAKKPGRKAKADE